MKETGRLDTEIRLLKDKQQQLANILEDKQKNLQNLHGQDEMKNVLWKFNVPHEKEMQAITQWFKNRSQV